MVPQSQPDADSGNDPGPDVALCLRNRRGVRVDAVPFLVVLSMTFLVSFSLGPVYAISLGWSLPAALAGSTAVFVLSGTGAYLQLVRQTHSAVREEIPAEQRFWRLRYAIVGLVVLSAGLALPFL